MARSSAAAPAKRGAAARAARKNGDLSVKFHGVDVSFPAKLPGTVAFDLGEIELRESAGESALGPMLGLLKSIIGDVQLYKIRTAIANEGTTVDETGGARLFVDLLSTILEEAGSSAGE